jgi:hypothetical protein
MNLTARTFIILIAMAGLASGCENMTTPQKGAVTGRR